MTAAVSQGDLGRLRRLAGAWYRANAWQRLSLGWPAWRDLTVLLDEIEARRAKGGDELCAHVRGDGIPEMEAAALLKAAELWGPDAELAIEETGTLNAHSRPVDGATFSGPVYVRCLNYAELAGGAA